MGKLSAALQERGYRLTVQRALILDAIESLAGHISAEDIYALIRERFPQVNISTVYRTLELVEQAGLAVHAHFDDGVAKWHLAEDSSHQHLVCRRCGKEQELDLEVVEPLAQELRERYSFLADIAHFAIIGLCQECADESG